ncbi:ATP12 family chaperone protein [Alteraurantiacibacter palmitatis]|uniref:ATP12 family chaperone protein n=1 Tax=Alteraurantiacibacter palmitatis TaxID=2054628 RepID=A0ABV7E783_9SPHN
MKRFYKEVTAAPVEGGWQVMLDGRPIRSQGGSPQIVPTQALAEMLAAEWRDQGEVIDTARFAMRDMADYAIDVVAKERGEVIEKLLTYGDTDTLLYRADPDEPLYQRQRAVWEPVVCACEARHGIAFTRISGVVHRPQKHETLAALRARLEALDSFTLAGLFNLTTLAASLITGLGVLEESADVPALFTAANAEEDWQAELWGWDPVAEDRRALRAEAFALAAEFVKAAQA